jgi:hypothetical protein
MLPATEDALGLVYKLRRELWNGQCRTVTKTCLKLLHCLSPESLGSHFLYERLNSNTLDAHDSCGQGQFKTAVDWVCNVMAHAQKSDFVSRRNERVHLNRQGRQFSGLLAAEVCASAVVMLDTPCCEVVWRLLATH